MTRIDDDGWAVELTVGDAVVFFQSDEDAEPPPKNPIGFEAPRTKKARRAGLRAGRFPRVPRFDIPPRSR